MTLEEQIKELEEKLALKKAYLSLELSFAKNIKLKKEVKEEVLENVKTFCEKMAERIDQTSKLVTQPEKQTPQAIKEKAKAGTALDATLLTTDSLSKELKLLITSMSKVKIVGMDDGYASVTAETKQGLKRFRVPKDELQLEQEGE